MQQLIKYFSISLLVSLIDAGISILLYEYVGLNQLIATNMGIIIGFIIQYHLSIKYVFRCQSSRRTLNIFIVTWLLGVGIANLTVFILLEKFHVLYAVSKIASMGASFFILYGLRKKWLGREE